MPKIEPKGETGQTFCMVCGKPFEYISNGEWIPATCPDCPPPIVAACMTFGYSKEISPEERIENVLHALHTLVNAPAHHHRMDAIRSTTAQLAEMWQKYRAGELEPIADDGLPF